jgi:hypothetical protein
MTKKEAISLFGKRSKDLAAALGKGESALSQWPEELDNDKTNLVLGAAVKRGIVIPDRFLK